MSSILKLTVSDFTLVHETKGPVLTLNIKGVVLVLFWSPGCSICKELIPNFQHLPQVMRSIKFCALNINQNQQILTMAKQTSSPIEYVPYIVLYVNGKPFLQFDDNPTLEKLIAFVQYATKLIESKKQFIDKGAKIESDVQKYTFGVPYHDLKCDDTVCYLSSATSSNVSAFKSGEGSDYSKAYTKPEQTPS